MKDPNLKNLYKNFDRFVYDFLLDGNSILSPDKKVLTREAINEVKQRYTENYKEGKEIFGDKIKVQFEGASRNARLVFVHAEWLWCYAVSDIKVNTKREIVLRTMGEESIDLDESRFHEGFGSGGPYHTQNKYHEIRFLVDLIDIAIDHRSRFNEGQSGWNLKGWIEQICFYHKYSEEMASYPYGIEEIKSILPDRQLAMCNILLYLCWPDQYERITSNAQKKAIVSTFGSLLSDKQKGRNIDKQIKEIRSELSGISANKEEFGITAKTIIPWDFDFYTHPIIRQLWYPVKDSENFYSQEQALQYKGAIILYGPPGTGKTHNAKLLARKLVLQKFLKDSDKVRSYLTKGENEIVASRIQRRQLHPRYGYEDFIAGIHLENGNTVPKKGDFLKFCETAATEPDQNYVLILDEINRVDLSQLLGEAFSALENRGETIDLPIGGFQLTVPTNLYVIGTMNEIDFSVENVDFALRRRFHWFFYGFDPEALKTIIAEKDQHNHLTESPDLDRFLRNVGQLNEAISDAKTYPELGEQYQIGHTFFAEVADIYYRYHAIEGRKHKMSKPLFGDGKPAATLWQISIEPILKAFLGNLDGQRRDDIIAHLSDIYLAD
jgi:5-methylcytosine-specific restriction protein B